jgi:hypothetical protein
MNPDTMRKNFSMDLAAKAKALEGAQEGRPTADVAAQLDDAFGMVTLARSRFNLSLPGRKAI